jgi:hypothetical protein
VRAGWEKLGDNSGLSVWPGFDSRAHSRATRTNDYNVVFVVMNLRLTQFLFIPFTITQLDRTKVEAQAVHLQDMDQM